MEVRFDILPQDLAAFARYRAKHPDRSWASQVRSTVLAVLIACSFRNGALVVRQLSARPRRLALDRPDRLRSGRVLGGRLPRHQSRSARAGRGIKKGHDINISLTIGPDWFRYTNQFAELARRWTNFDKIGVTKDHCFFFVSPTNGYIVPRRAFASTDDYNDFVDAARRYFDGAKAFADNPYEDVK